MKYSKKSKKSKILLKKSTPKSKKSFKKINVTKKVLKEVNLLKKVLKKVILIKKLLRKAAQEVNYSRKY